MHNPVYALNLPPGVHIDVAVLCSRAQALPHIAAAVSQHTDGWSLYTKRCAALSCHLQLVSAMLAAVQLCHATCSVMLSCYLQGIGVECHTAAAVSMNLNLPHASLTAVPTTSSSSTLQSGLCKQ